MRLKILISVTVTLMLGYTLFWHYMAGEVQNRIEAWVLQQNTNGLSVRYEHLDISGFPYRMELTLTGLNLNKTSKDQLPILFTLPKAIMVAFPWNINHAVIISDGGALRIGNRIDPQLTMDFGKIRSSVIVNLARRQFQRASLVMENVTWREGDIAKKLKASEARELKIYIFRPEEDENNHNLELPVLAKLYLEANDVIAQEIPVAIFGKKADQIKLDMEVHGEKIPPYNKEGLAFWRDSGGTISIKNFAVFSGEMDIELKGEATLDQDLKPLGAFTSKIHGIDHIVGILGQQDGFQAEPGSLILDELKRMSKTEEGGSFQGKKAIDLTINLQGGLLFLGPIPVFELSPIVE